MADSLGNFGSSLFSRSFKGPYALSTQSRSLLTIADAELCAHVMKQLPKDQSLHPPARQQQFTVFALWAKTLFPQQHKPPVPHNLHLCHPPKGAVYISIQNLIQAYMGRRGLFDLLFFRSSLSPTRSELL